MKKLLPQANTLATVIRTFKLIANMPGCKLEEIAIFNKFDIRQASYYTNACYFLDLIKEDLSLTPLGQELMNQPRDVRIRIYELIIKHNLIGALFAKVVLYPRDKAIEESKELVRSKYPIYGEAVIDRRTRCLIGWCEEIITYINSHSK